VEVIHQPLGPGQPHAHPGLGNVLAAQDFFQVGNPRPLVDDRRLKTPVGIVSGKFDFALLGVLKNIPRQFRNGRGDAHLVLPFEAQGFRDLPGPLARENDVALVANLDGEQGNFHAEVAWENSRATSTVTSSRPLRKSR